MQVQSLLPLLALVHPIVWRLLELYGTAKVVAAFEQTASKPVSVVIIVLRFALLVLCCKCRLLQTKITCL